MTPKVWVYNDGGRKDAGYRGDTGDCLVRAIAIATELAYQAVYDAVNLIGTAERRPSKRRKSGARTGISNRNVRKLLNRLGWDWTPTMHIGSGCKVHLRAAELPAGRLIAAVSKHFVAVVDGVIHDTHDCSRGRTRCMYGYYQKADGDAS